MYTCNESLEPKFTTTTNSSVILIIRHQCLDYLLWIHVGIFAKIVSFCWAIEQSLKDNSQTLKQIEDVSCRHSGVIAGIHFCATQDLNIIV